MPIRLFADGALLEPMLRMHEEHGVQGFTTNPTLCRAASVPDYVRHAEFLTRHLPSLPLSFEVTADDPQEMLRQALRLADVGPNLYVKIPVSHLNGTPTTYLLRALKERQVKINVTAITTVPQLQRAARVLRGGAPCFLSIFAGRIADTGRDPQSIVRTSLQFLGLPSNFSPTTPASSMEVIWASTREVLNIQQAEALGCDIITVTEAILAKRTMLGTPLEDLSRQTIRQFHRDAQEAGYDF